MKELKFQIGDRVSGYLCEDGLAFLGYIVGFLPDDDNGKKRARVRICGTKDYDVCFLDTCHPMPLNEINHTKETFLAAISRCSPILYFKDSKSRRDFSESLWEELVRFSTNKD